MIIDDPRGWMKIAQRHGAQPSIRSIKFNFLRDSIDRKSARQSDLNWIKSRSPNESAAHFIFIFFHFVCFLLHGNRFNWFGFFLLASREPKRTHIEIHAFVHRKCIARAIYMLNFISTSWVLRVSLLRDFCYCYYLRTRWHKQPHEWNQT